MILFLIRMIFGLECRFCVLHQEIAGRSIFKRLFVSQLGSIGQHRSIFIQTQTTPNPLSLMFYPGKPVMEVGSADFPNSRAGMTSPLAKALFKIDGKFTYSMSF